MHVLLTTVGVRLHPIMGNPAEILTTVLKNLHTCPKKLYREHILKKYLFVSIFFFYFSTAV